MSLCNPLPTANPLNYCGAKEYGPGTIHVGVLPADREADGLCVLLRNLATNRTQIVALQGDLDVVEIQQPTDLSPSSFYELKVCAVTDIEGINPIAFFPYFYSGSDYVAGYDTVDGVNVKFIKIFDGDGAVHSHADQYITLA